MQINCLPGLLHGIASIIVIWLVTYTFPISIPLCPIFPHFVCLALGQRLYCPHISLSDTLEGLSLLFRFIGTLAYCLSHGDSSYCLASSCCLAIPISVAAVWF